MDAIKNDAELISYMLLKPEELVLGFCFRRKLGLFLENKLITQEQHDYLFSFYQKDIDKKTKQKKSTFETQARDYAQFIEQAKCTRCGDLVNSGTYGFIFNTTDNPNTVIKGSKGAHAEGQRCPEEFVKEFRYYSSIALAWPGELELIKLINNYGGMVIENRRCYYEMDKILPIVLTYEEEERLNEKIKTSSDNPRLVDILNIIKTTRELYMVVPGITDAYYFANGGGLCSEWREIGYDVVVVLFEILGIDIRKYNHEMAQLLTKLFNANIMLIDVEFMLGYRVLVNEDGTTRNDYGVFLIDFDKVQIIDEASLLFSMNILTRLLEQDMFSDAVKIKVTSNLQRGGRRKKNKTIRRSMKKKKPKSKRRGRK